MKVMRRRVLSGEECDVISVITTYRIDRKCPGGPTTSGDVTLSSASTCSGLNTTICADALIVLLQSQLSGMFGVFERV